VEIFYLIFSKITLTKDEMFCHLTLIVNYLQIKSYSDIFSFRPYISLVSLTRYYDITFNLNEKQDMCAAGYLCAKWPMVVYRLPLCLELLLSHNLTVDHSFEYFVKYFSSC